LANGKGGFSPQAANLDNELGLAVGRGGDAAELVDYGHAGVFDSEGNGPSQVCLLAVLVVGCDLKLKTLAGTREGECWRVHFKLGGTPDLDGRDGQVRLFVQLVFRRKEKRKKE
jgi:hypothetical protein